MSRSLSRARPPGRTRRAVATLVGPLLVAGLAVGLAGCSADGVVSRAPETSATGTPPATLASPTGATPTADPTTSASPSPTPSPTPTGPSSDERRFERVDRITGNDEDGHMSPKSVVASGDGLYVAQNMMYQHTISVFDDDKQLVATIPDTVQPADFGYPQYEGELRGAPVEAAFSPDGAHLWVSNYSMYGPGFSRPGADSCSPDSGIDPSFLYRVDTDSLEIDAIVEVGAVPKYVEVTPDGRHVLVTNWCTYDLSIVDTATVEEVARIDIGRYPRGIAVTADSETAYVAVMGSTHLAVVDLPAAIGAGFEPGGGDDAVSRFEGIGSSPRHLNLSPDDSTLYVTLNGDGRVAKVDAATGEVLGTVATGQAPRSAALSTDGTALFVVNYESDTVSRVRTSDLEVLETVDVDHHPIGIAYDAHSQEIWVAAYVGSLTVFADAGPQ